MADPLEPCDCDHGWRYVSRRYADHIAEGMALGEGVSLGSVVAGLLNSVYPCRPCRPGPFYRWSGGHFADDHDVASCADCIAAHGGSRPARRHAKVAGTHTHGDEPPPRPTDEYDPTPRRDIDG